MKKRIAILGSTGSIGKTLLKIIDKDKKNFQIILLSSNKNYLGLLAQAKKYKVKNLIITDLKSYKNLKYKCKKLDINIFNNFNDLNNIIKKKLDYLMNSITGIDGLVPTIKSIKFTKKIAIANKEAIICGWNLINAELKKNKTKFLPVDSEHFSIWYALKNNFSSIEKIFLTASGGPFKNLPISKFKDITIKQALNHPNWKMGKKISIDSATLMNKVFEIIEAKNIFNLNYKQLEILIHPKSYVHAIIKFNNGFSKIIVHDTNMKYPIFNTLYDDMSKEIKSKNIRLDILNNLCLARVDYNKFPMVKLLSSLPPHNSLFETVIVSINDALVNLFLKKQIKFSDISKLFFKNINKKEYKKYKKIKPKTYKDIINLDKFVRLKLNAKSL